MKYETGFFNKKLLPLVPVQKLRTRMVNNCVAAHYAVLENFKNRYESGFRAPYLEYADQCLSFGYSAEGKYIIFVTDDLNAALKVSGYIAQNNDLAKEFRRRTLEESYDTDFICIDDDCDESAECSDDHKIRIIDLNMHSDCGKMYVNPYILLHDRIVQSEAVLYTGLSNADIDDKLDAIAACTSYLKFLTVAPEQLEQPWFQRILLEFRSDLFYIGESKQDYYCELVNELFRDMEDIMPDENVINEFVKRLMKKRGKQLREEDIAWHLDMAAMTAQKEGKTVELRHLTRYLGNAVPVSEKLTSLTGLSSVKKILTEYTALLNEGRLNPKLKSGHNNMIFYGNPGSGKTMCAKLISDIMYETGNSCGCFVSVTRSDFIGKYVGNTAVMVRKRFEEARGGVLFVDEAGFMVKDSSDRFVSEAIKEFVRYMEMYPDVTVVFALYTSEVKDFLSLDAGLASRVVRLVEFPDYSDEELLNIAEVMFKENGYILSQGCKSLIAEYIRMQRNKERKNFGNAREMRKLTESCIMAISLRHLSQMDNTDIQVVDADNETRYVLFDEDIRMGIERLKAQNCNKQAAQFGFGNSHKQNGDMPSISEGTQQIKVGTRLVQKEVNI